MKYLTQNVELWAFLIVAIPLVLKWLYILTFNYLNLYKFTLVSAMKRSNKKIFQSGEDLIEEIKNFPNQREEKIDEFVRNSLIQKVYDRPFHLADIIDKLECLKKIGLLSTDIHTIMLNQIIEINNQVYNLKKQKIDLERQLDVDTILIPTIELPNNSEIDRVKEQIIYLELKRRFKQISELDYTFTQVIMYIYRKKIARN